MFFIHQNTFKYFVCLNFKYCSTEYVVLIYQTSSFLLINGSLPEYKTFLGTQYYEWRYSTQRI